MTEKEFKKMALKFVNDNIPLLQRDLIHQIKSHPETVDECPFIFMIKMILEYKIDFEIKKTNAKNDEQFSRIKEDL